MLITIKILQSGPSDTFHQIAGIAKTLEQEANTRMCDKDVLSCEEQRYKAVNKTPLRKP
jgi:hypothetical protein